MNMQTVALNPFAAIQHTPHGTDPRTRIDLEEALQGIDCAHLICDWTDPANPGDHVGYFLKGTTDEELLEQPRWLIDLQFQLFDGVVSNAKMQRPFPFDAGQYRHMDRDLALTHPVFPRR